MGTKIKQIYLYILLQVLLYTLFRNLYMVVEHAIYTTHNIFQDNVLFCCPLLDKRKTNPNLAKKKKVFYPPKFKINKSRCPCILLLLHYPCWGNCPPIPPFLHLLWLTRHFVVQS